MGHSFELKDTRSIHSRVLHIPTRYNEVVIKEVEERLKARIRVHSSSPWSFPVVIATTKDGLPRFCVDYRQLQRVTKPDRWPVPKVEEISNDLAGAVEFTTLGLCTGYCQVRMSAACKEMTTFTYRYKNSKFEVMQF